MTETTDAIVIGAGVIGLAVARELATHGRQVIVIERNAGIGQETSSRNSEVIHAGIYYSRNSLKARLCVAGKERLYAYCREKDIPHERCGKVIVAVGEAQVSALEALRERARDNGVGDLEWLDAAALQAREPAVCGAAGLWSPSSGIIDSHAFMLALQGDLDRHGGAVALVSEVREGRVEGDRIRLSVASGGGAGSGGGSKRSADSGGGTGTGSGTAASSSTAASSGTGKGTGKGDSGPGESNAGREGSGPASTGGDDGSGAGVSEIEARTVINAAGLDASRVARAFAAGDSAAGSAIASGNIGGASADSEHAAIPETRFAKGSYFLYDGPSPFNHLVYPLPVDGGLGIHATHDLAGSLRFGPDVEWIDTVAYEVDGSRAAKFAHSIATWWPDLDPARLNPGYAGVRPKLVAAGEPPGDFLIMGPAESGHGQLVHLLGFESPGLTASLALAKEVQNRLG